MKTLTLWLCCLLFSPLAWASAQALRCSTLPGPAVLFDLGTAPSCSTPPPSINTACTPVYFQSLGAGAVVPADGQGVVPVLTFNGEGDALRASSSAFWHVGNGEHDAPFYWMAWVKLATPTDHNFLSKYAVDGPDAREWTIQVSGHGQFCLAMRDEALAPAGNKIGRCQSQTMPIEQWLFLAITYGGCGNESCIALWQGTPTQTPVRVDDASNSTDAGLYVAQVPQDTDVLLGAFHIGGVPAEFFEGDLLGGAGGMVWGKGVLSANDLQLQYRLTCQMAGWNCP